MGGMVAWPVANSAAANTNSTAQARNVSRWPAWPPNIQFSMELPDLSLNRAADHLISAARCHLAADDFCLNAWASNSRRSGTLVRRIIQITPIRSNKPAAARPKLVYFDCPEMRGRLVTGV